MPGALLTLVAMNIVTASDRIGSASDRQQPDAGVASAPSLRSVEAVHRSTGFHWVGNGFFVSTYFPSHELPAERVSPFLLMDYGPARSFPPLASGKRGVGWHPHRGFETVTLAWEGAVAHRDNAGHAGVIRAGDAQWMTAASGIFHEEYHEAEFARRGGRFHMMQLWVNLPRKDKLAAPAYQGLQAEQIPNVALPGGGIARVLAGEFAGAKGPARTFTAITMLDVRLDLGARLRVPLPATYNALAVVAEGRITTSTTEATAGELVLFANDASELELQAKEASHVILLAGEPIDEPIVQYGPFVMNSADEVRQALLDVQRGAFGEIPD
jgi:quercetin 2,3-dioxygenase